VDAEVMIAALCSRGWQRATTPAEAEVILVNTCGFIEPAKQESIDVTLDYCHSCPDSKVVMTGCLSQRYARELDAAMPEVAGFIGNRAPERVAEFLEAIENGNRRLYLPEGRIRSHPRTLLSMPGSAYVKIAEGCDNRCSFCAIPQIRGRMRSKPQDQVVSEIAELLRDGIKEINLVAQDLASYGRDYGGSAIELLESIADLTGEHWVRLLYVYPEHFPIEIFPLLRANPQLLPYFDIPFQHASAPILRSMGRPGDGESYLRLIDRIRNELPDAIIRSTFLVGFFGEHEAQFDELLSFQKRAQFDWLGVFPYSPEEGTPAMAGGRRPDVPRKTAERRAAVIMERQQSITRGRLERFVGRDLRVLIEELVPEEPLVLGRCYAQAPDVDGAVVVHVRQEPECTPVSPGEFVRSRVVRCNGLDLEAVPL
jgi:ribosomal protein S12 methylthiotransferase